MTNRELLECIEAIQDLPRGDEQCIKWIDRIIDDDLAVIEMLARFVSEEDMIRMMNNPDKKCWER